MFNHPKERHRPTLKVNETHHHDGMHFLLQLVQLVLF